MQAHEAWPRIEGCIGPKSKAIWNRLSVAQVVGAEFNHPVAPEAALACRWTTLVRGVEPDERDAVVAYPGSCSGPSGQAHRLRQSERATRND